MYLKSLSMRGFKSFAEKAVLEFEPGITAIVGPNGSGKSNITDAILWVLGEQSPRSLRGSSMEDVIFAGSSVKSPLGIAEVSLCLDNSDKSIPIEFSEVIVSRRVLRSGESEYRINNSPCRLIDIFELLSDTGLGREMHSVVSQGKVEEVLNCRPEERRALIDEAANVLKYRKRKEKASRKIISVEDKLIRIKDILREVRQQLNPIRRQAREAEVFNQLSLELNNLEINLTVVELKELQLSWDAVSQQEDELNNQIVKLKEESKKEEEELKILKEKMHEIDFSTDNLRESVSRLENIREQLNGNILLVKEKVRNFEITLKRVLNEKNNLKAVSEKRFFEISKIQEDKKQIGEKIKITCDNLNSKKEALAGLKSKTEETKSNFSKIQTELSGHKAESNRFAERLNALSNTIVELNSRINVLKVKEEGIISRKEEAERDFLVKDNEKKSFDSKLDNLKNSMADCREAGVLCPNIDDVERIKNHFALSVKEELDLSASNLSEKENELSVILNEKNKLIEKLNEINDDKINFENKLLNLKEKIKWLEGERGNHERIRNQFFREEDNFKKNINELKIEQISLNERNIYLKKQSTSLEESLTDYNTSVKAKEENISVLEIQIEKTRGLLKVLFKLAGFCGEALDRLLNSVKDEKGVFVNIEEEVEKKENFITVLRSKISDQNEKLHHFDISKAQLELQVNALVQKLTDEFNVPIEKALEKHFAQASRDEMYSKIKEIKLKITSLGPINPIAIDEHKALEERYNLLTEQIEDLNKAKKALKDVIEEINNKIESTFLEVFEKVNENFKAIFSCLFEGGEAELIVTDPDNLLETGIEMEVNPCGKRLQKLSLLSGGEKSLAALALLFAIHKTRPSPFYILDEVEAALDDNNIRRFISLLGMLKNETQFLIVTHQKKTMEIADLLYGTTMQADGISKLVSQKLHQEEEVCAIS